ncbi:MAG: MraY family glycosyltransferase [Terriglobia bacterium]
MIGGLVTLDLGTGSASSLFTTLLACAVPAFAGGLAEDVTRRVSVGTRLLLTFVAAGIGFFLLDARITAVDVPGVDSLLGFSACSFAFTLFAVGGFANAMNIVDGFNGLAGAIALIYVAAIAYVAHAVGDGQLALACLLLGAAMAGFLIFNYPRGLVFLGDGGAYAIGFMIAELAVLLVQRNSSVSPWFALTLFVYPAWETFFSIYRKKVVRRMSPGQPDGLHLHMLVHKRLVRRAVRKWPHRVFWENALTSPFLWALALLGVVPAVLFWDTTWALELSAGVFVIFYCLLYRRLVRFGTLGGKLIQSMARRAKRRGEAVGG